MSPHPHLFALIGMAALGLAAPANAQTTSSQSATPQALQRILQDQVNPGGAQLAPGLGSDPAKSGACPTCVTGGLVPLVSSTIPSRPQNPMYRPGYIDGPITGGGGTSRPATLPASACSDVAIKVGPSKIGVINGGDQTLTFAVKLGAIEQIVKLAPGEIETVTLSSGVTAQAGTSDNSIPTQALTPGKVYRLKAQDGKWAFVAD